MNRFDFKPGLLTARTAMALNDIAAWIDRMERSRKGDSEFPTVERRRVKLTAHNGGTPPIYTGVEQSFTIAGVEEDKPNGESFSPTNQPIYERNGQTVSAAALTAGFHCWIDRRTLVDGVPSYEFDIGNPTAATSLTSARIYLDSNQTISNSSFTVLTGFSETDVFGATQTIQAFDNGSYFDSGSSDRLTFPADGIYLVGATVNWGGGTTGQRLLQITEGSGGNYIVSDTILPVDVTFSSVQSVSSVVKGVASGYLRVRVYHNQGSNLDVLGKNSTTNARTMFWIQRLS